MQEATVNLATEKAHVVFNPAQTSVDQMRAAVDKAGYKVAEVSQPSASAVPAVDAGVATQDPHDVERQREIDNLKRKWTISLAAGLVMMTLSFIPLNVPMDVLAPVLLIVATLVQFWAGAPIYRAAWAAARHGSTNMNTLIAVGTSVAYGYSAFVTLWSTPRDAMGFSAAPVL